jgi:gluconate 2-dehydrogenase gamma chain
MSASESPVQSGISRREAIRRAALLAGVALSADWLPAVDRGTTAMAQAQHLAPAQSAIVSAVTERILPRTDTPGAIDVGVPAFIDLLYGEFMTPAERQLLTDGLTRVETMAKSTGGAAFTTLSPDRQDAILRAIAVDEEGRPQSFFGLIRSATILGYFTSEQVGRNVLHYDPVPGAFDGCVPIEQVGRRSWTT